MYENGRAAMTSIKTGSIQFASFCIQELIFCWYSKVILKNIRFLKNLIAANRKANRNAHLPAALDLISLFGECYSINFPRYDQTYLEQMRNQ